jgi:hypothetical protein
MFSASIKQLQLQPSAQSLSISPASAVSILNFKKTYSNLALSSALRALLHVCLHFGNSKAT